MLVGMVSLIGSVSAVVLSNSQFNPNAGVAPVSVNQVVAEKSYILQGLSLDSLVTAVEHSGGNCL